MSIDNSKFLFESNLSKRISYILPTRNHANKLDGALERMRKLKGPNDELIVIDGVSTDNTSEVVKKYADLIDIFISEPDSIHKEAEAFFYDKPFVDPINAVNKGILLARGKYIKTISDDDIYYPAAMEQAVQVMEIHPEIGLLLCGGVKEKKGQISNNYVPPGADYGNSPEDLFRYPGGRCGVGQIFRRKALALVGLHPYTLVDTINHQVIIHPDAEYTFKFIQTGVVVKFCRVKLFYSQYSHDHEQSFMPKTEQYWIEAARRYCSRSFYLKYFLRKKIEQSLLYGKFLQCRKILRKKIKNPYFQKFLGKKERITPEQYVWDGGLS